MINEETHLCRFISAEILCAVHTVGCVQWTSVVNQNAMFAVRFNQFRTASECRDFCSRLLQCVAVDFDANSDLCWVHFDASNLHPDNVFNLPNVTQSILSRSCETTTTSTTTATTTTTTTTTATTTVTTSVSTSTATVSIRFTSGEE